MASGGWPAEAGRDPARMLGWLGWEGSVVNRGWRLGVYTVCQIRPEALDGVQRPAEQC
jgi:hypothetical protein